jgi:hypothetical protein
MIYKTSYFRKELRQAYAEDKAGTSRKLAFALFLGLLSFAVFFVLQSLKKSVLSDAVPEIMQASYFSTVYIYIHLAFILNSIYFILYYDYLFFSEIRKNSWYLLIKMGYRPTMMIFQKFIALLSSVLFIYTVGFCFVVLLTVLLKYNFIYAYLPSLYFSGLLDLFLISALAMNLSLFVDTVANARYLIAFSSVAIPVVKAATGYYSILSNRVTMQNIRNLFDVGRSAYILVAGFLTVACCLVSIFRANNLSRYYILRKLEWSKRYPEIKIGRLDTKTGYPVPDRPEPKRRTGLINTVITAVFILFICLALLFNGFIILLSTAAPGNEVTIRGTIPYIFESDTMQPGIMYNDLTFFRRVDSQYPVSLGQIVLFQQDKVVYVERIIEISGAGIKVDIDNYPPLSETGSMLKTIRRQAIYGVYDGRNRWLGALILFSNTLLGRIVFLLLPAVLLFYRKHLLRLLKKLTS